MSRWDRIFSVTVTLENSVPMGHLFQAPRRRVLFGFHWDPASKVSALRLFGPQWGPISSRIFGCRNLCPTGVQVTFSPPGKKLQALDTGIFTTYVPLAHKLEMRPQWVRIIASPVATHFHRSENSIRGIFAVGSCSDGSPVSLPCIPSLNFAPSGHEVDYIGKRYPIGTPPCHCIARKNARPAGAHFRNGTIIVASSERKI